MNKRFFFILTCLCSMLALNSGAQKITATERKFFAKKEDSLKVYADSMINAETAGKRFLSDSQFVKTFVRTLVAPNSFYYPFDSLPTVSRLYPPDSSFRIF